MVDPRTANNCRSGLVIILAQVPVKVHTAHAQRFGQGLWRQRGVSKPLLKGQVNPLLKFAFRNHIHFIPPSLELSLSTADFFFMKKLFNFQHGLEMSATKTNYLDGLLSKNPKVVKAIYSEFAPRIQRMVASHGGTKEDARDVFQEALVVIWRKARVDGFELTSSFYSYLYGICFYTWQREKKKKDNNTVTLAPGTELKDNQDIEKELEISERRKLFKQHLDKMDDSCQRVLRIFFAGVKMQDIADKVGVDNEHAARNRKYRCQKKLENSILNDPRFRELSINSKNDPSRKPGVGSIHCGFN